MSSDLSAETTPAKDAKWCFSWLASDPTASGTKRAALVRNSKWIDGTNITVSFLDGSEAVKNRVKQIAGKWTTPATANLTLVFMDNTNETDIRISFLFTGSWSTIGTSCKSVTDTSKPTMNFGWLDEDTPDEEAERVVLHEFGHALGLIHEHQNPAGGINWNREQVIKDLSGPPNNWSEATIEHNMFEPYKKNETNFTALDFQSIMLYPIPAKWTTDGFSVGMNNNLSATDKTFIHQQYP
jgi:hypothetical protein